MGKIFMQRENIIKAVARVLESYSYENVIISNMHASFDILARNKLKTLVIKVVYNIDTIDRRMAKDMIDVALFMDADPLIIGEVSKGKRLGKSVVYSRFSINCVSIESFESVLDNINIPLASKYVGTKAEVDKDRMKSLRVLSGMSLSSLAKSANVSKDTLYKLEKFGGYASLGTVERTEARLGDSVRFNKMTRVVHEYKVSGVSYKIGHTDIKAVYLNSSPFNIIGRRKNYYEAGIESNPRTMKKKAKLFAQIMECFENNYSFFVSERKDGKFDGINVISKKRLSKIESESELVSEIE